MVYLSHNQLQFGINLARKGGLAKRFGFKIKKYSELSTGEMNILENELDLFLKIHLVKKDFVLKSISLNKLNKVKNGSYSGYRLIRGLPVKNQRTKTNAKTARKMIGGVVAN